MKAHYAYGVHMPGIGLLTKTVADTEKESIALFASFEPRLPWLDVLMKYVESQNEPKVKK